MWCWTYPGHALLWYPLSSPMSSSSDVIDLERSAMAGGVSLLVCCGAAEGEQPNADFMFSLLV
ncbi:hypothetical protein EYF80_039366 [Liparis tanakae]|uniref:Uncharacterized protein n=1 Tax=Liparis tanakae TaxID=230148 RepID=A0A4Z2GB41_9TELE|nr:hypothetical protein EYF80_039366 [Liparis tanakae]